MKTIAKKSTIYFDPQIHKALRLKAAETDSSDVFSRFYDNPSQDIFRRYFLTYMSKLGHHLSAFSEDQKFENLYLLIQLMKSDGQVFKSEIHYCEEIAERLGYKKAVVGELSSRIYSDPTITADRKMLMERAHKFLK